MSKIPNATPSESKSLAELLPVEQARLRELKAEYIKIGPPGYFGAQMIEMALREADQAVMSGDVVRMLSAYEMMKGYE